MAQTLRSYQLNLYGPHLLLKEVGQRATPYTNEFEWNDNEEGMNIKFTDGRRNRINVGIHRISTIHNQYELVFCPSSDNHTPTTATNFFRVVATALEVIHQFTDRYKPFEILVEPTCGQRSKIWLAYIKANLKDTGQLLLKTPTGFILQYRQNKPHPL